MSSSTRVVVRADAGPAYGIGHVMRCVALAEEFAARGREVVFVADLDAVPWAAAQVRSRGFGHVQPSDDEVGSVLALEPAFVVLDSYHLDGAVYAGLRERVGVLALVDGEPGERPADLWVDQNIGAEADTWTVPAGTDRLAGLDYALMRDDLRARRPSLPDRVEADPPTVFAFFGGTDPYGAAPAVTAALAGTGVPCSMTVVAPTDALAAACRAVAPAPGQRIEVIGTTDTLPDRVRDADVVLSAAGTSSWELLCLGAAAGLLCVADNQRTSYERATGAGLVAGLGYLEALEPGALVGTLTGLLTDADRRRDLRERGWTAVDGRGRERVADACDARFGTRSG